MKHCRGCGGGTREQWRSASQAYGLARSEFPFEKHTVITMNIHSSKHQDDVEKNARSSYFNLPALDVSVAFPQATPATKFPPCASDYYQSDDLLTSEEQAVRMKVRECMEKEIAPIMVEYWEKAEFPFHVMPKLGALRVAGGTIKKLLELMLVVLLLCWCIPLGNAHYCTVRIRGAEAEIFTFFGSVKHHCLLGFD